MDSCFCCDRRLTAEGCHCSAAYCRNCLRCGLHCRCRRPNLVADEVTADEPVVIEGDRRAG